MYTLARSTRLDPFAELERLFDGCRNGSAAACALAPVLDVAENEEAYTVRVELPGVAPADVNVTVEDALLTVSGEKKAEETQADGNGKLHRSERSYGRFTRTVQFPAAIDANEVTAAHKNGVLTVRLPKDAKARARSVKIQAE